MSFPVEIVSVERPVWSGEAEFVVAPGSQGELGIYHGHAPLITYMRPGNISVKDAAGEMRIFYVSGGVLEVQPSGVIILSDVSVRAEDLDEAQILEAKAKAEELLRDKTNKLEYAEVETKLSQMLSQLQTIEKYRSTQK